MNFRNRSCKQEFLTPLLATQAEVFTGNSRRPLFQARFHAAFSALGYLASYLQNPWIAEAFSRKRFTLRELSALQAASL
jgi:hypothetical protein